MARKDATEPSKPAPGWKDHPLAIAAAAVVATIVIFVLVVKEIVIPTQMAALNNQINALDIELKTLRGKHVITQQKGDSASSALSELQQRLQAAESKLREAQHANLLSRGNPYPTGLGRVKVGDSIDKLGGIYPESSMDRSRGGYVNVKQQHTIFPDITYYFDEDSPKKTITHIRFNMGFENLNDKFLQAKLVEALGEPKAWRRKGYYSWDVGKLESVFKSNDDTYLVMRAGHRLGYWPKK